MWYAASVIMYTEFKDGNQDCYPIWENVFLISADSPEEAFEKARKRALLDEGDSSGTLECEGRPATWKFGGIRKLIECQDPDKPPTDGTEITYSRFILKKKKDFEKLVNGEVTYIYYEE